MVDCIVRANAGLHGTRSPKALQQRIERRILAAQPDQPASECIHISLECLLVVAPGVHGNEQYLQCRQAGIALQLRGHGKRGGADIRAMGETEEDQRWMAFEPRIAERATEMIDEGKTGPPVAVQEAACRPAGQVARHGQA